MKNELLDYLSSNTGALTLGDVFLNFLVAVLLGVLIFICYRMTHSSALYSARFNVSLSMLTLVTTLVMGVIGNNIALSLGMVGALSIVRFRTAIKDPRDTAYIFWCIAVGICCGVSEYIIAAIGSAFIFVFLLLFGMLKNNDRYIMVIRAQGDNGEKIEQLMHEEFKGKARLCVENSSRDSQEYIYELSTRMIEEMKKKEISVTELLYKIQDVVNVNIICQNDDINR